MEKSEVMKNKKIKNRNSYYLRAFLDYLSWTLTTLCEKRPPIFIEKRQRLLLMLPQNKFHQKH